MVSTPIPGRLVKVEHYLDTVDHWSIPVSPTLFQSTAPQNSQFDPTIQVSDHSSGNYWLPEKKGSMGRDGSPFSGGHPWPIGAIVPPACWLARGGGRGVLMESRQTLLNLDQIAQELARRGHRCFALAYGPTAGKFSLVPCRSPKSVRVVGARGDSAGPLPVLAGQRQQGLPVVANCSGAPGVLSRPTPGSSHAPNWQDHRGPTWSPTWRSGRSATRRWAGKASLCSCRALNWMRRLVSEIARGALAVPDWLVVEV